MRLGAGDGGEISWASADDAGLLRQINNKAIRYGCRDSYDKANPCRVRFSCPHIQKCESVLLSAAARGYCPDMKVGRLFIIQNVLC